MAILRNKDPQAPRPAEHVAIIMDGNGRWATERGWPRLVGHRRGAERVREIVRACPDLGIRWLTVYAFSTENWKRSTEEVLGLMAIFARYIEREADRLAAEGVRMRFIGDRSRLDKGLQTLMAGIEARTAGYTRLNFTVAINYGGRDEVLRAVRDGAPDTFYGVASDNLIHPSAPGGYPPYIATLPPPSGRTLAQLRAAATANAGELQPQLDYGAALLADGQRVAATDAFSAALAVDPSSVEAKVGKIIATYAKDNPAASFGQMGPLVRDNPGNPSPRLHLAMMLLWIRDSDTARAELRQVATADPDGRLGQVAQQFLDSLQS